MKIYLPFLQVCLGIVIGFLMASYGKNESNITISQPLNPGGYATASSVDADQNMPSNSKVDAAPCSNQNQAVLLKTETLDQLKQHMREVVAEELQQSSDRQLALAQQQKSKANSAPTHEQQQTFEQAMLLVQLAADSGTMTMKDIEMQSNIAELPATLRKQLMVNITEKFNSGELDAEYFLGIKLPFRK